MLRGTLGPAGTLQEVQTTWAQQDRRPAQATPDGQFLVFLSAAHVTDGDESVNVPQLFEYDATTERITRVSIGQGGTHRNDGAVATFRDAPQIPAQPFTGVDLPTSAHFALAVSSDGSRVFFTSAAGLTPEATPGDTSLYEYRGGNVFLISDGKDASSSGREPTVRLLGTTPTGGDVFFVTSRQLVPQDGETGTALYDAREEGGFRRPRLCPAVSGKNAAGL